MNEVNKTLYIPLYSKAYVSRRGIILSDEWAEGIWDSEGFFSKLYAGRTAKSLYKLYEYKREGKEK